MDAVFTIRGEGSDRKATIRASTPGTGGAVFITVDGLENKNGNPLMTIDLHEGTLALFVWGDREGEEYTHRIDLDTGKITESYR